MARETRIVSVREGVWRFRFDWGTDPISKKRAQQWVTVFGSRSEAENRLRELQRKRDSQRIPSSSISLSELRVLWDDSTQKRGRRRATTAAVEKSAYLRYLDPLLGDRSLNSITPELVTRSYDLLLESVSESLLLRLHQQLSSILHWAYNRGYVTDVVTERVELPRVTRRRPSAPCTEDVHRLLHSLRGDPLWLVCRIAATTGLRRGEIAGLRFGDIDHDRGSLSVERSVSVLKGGKPFIAPTKTGITGEGMFYLDDELLDELSSERAYAQGIAESLGVDVDSLYVFRSTNPLFPVRPDGLTQRLSRHVKACGQFEEITLHSLRRFVASTLVERGVDLATASRVLRHTRLSTTELHYVSPREESARQSTREIGRSLVANSGVRGQ